MSTWALVAVKARAEAKSRLAGVLTLEARIALVRAMLDHVLAVLSASPGIDHVAVVSPERDMVPSNISVIAGKWRGLNRAVGRGVAVTRAMGAREILVFPADLPCLAISDVEALLAGMRKSGCAIAGDQAGAGTNAIALDMEQLDLFAFRFLFGRDSLSRHVNQAEKLGLEPQIIRRPGLSFDLDEPEALRILGIMRGSSAMRGAL